MRIHFLALLLVVVGTTACASVPGGPVRVTQNVWSSGTEVKIVNVTDRFVEAEVGTFHLGVPPGSDRVVVVNPGTIIFSYPVLNLVVTARVCQATRTIPAFVPPPWAADTVSLGSLAITDAYLATNPSEYALRERVRSIGAFLDARGNLGRKAAMRNLEEYVRPHCQVEDLATQFLRGEGSGATSPAAARQAPGLEPVETAGSPKGGRGNGQQPELRGEGRAGAVTGDW